MSDDVERASALVEMMDPHLANKTVAKSVVDGLRLGCENALSLLIAGDQQSKERALQFFRSVSQIELDIDPALEQKLESHKVPDMLILGGAAGPMTFNLSSQHKHVFNQPHTQDWLKQLEFQSRWHPMDSSKAMFFG